MSLTNWSRFLIAHFTHFSAVVTSQLVQKVGGSDFVGGS